MQSHKNAGASISIADLIKYLEIKGIGGESHEVIWGGNIYC